MPTSEIWNEIFKKNYTFCPFYKELDDEMKSRYGDKCSIMDYPRPERICFTLTMDSNSLKRVSEIKDIKCSGCPRLRVDR